MVCQLELAMLVNELTLVKQSPDDKLMMASFTATIAALLVGPLRKNRPRMIDNHNMGHTIHPTNEPSCFKQGLYETSGGIQNQVGPTKGQTHAEFQLSYNISKPIY